VSLRDAVRMAVAGEITESISKVTLLHYALTHGVPHMGNL
jgi:hypothetical protein